MTSAMSVINDQHLSLAFNLALLPDAPEGGDELMVKG